MRKKQLVILIIMAACLLARFPASGCPYTRLPLRAGVLGGGPLYR
jgi:hypothetical protein